MYGKYTVELQEFARSHASRLREEEAQRRDEQRNLRYSTRRKRKSRKKDSWAMGSIFSFFSLGAKAWRSCKQFVIRHIGEDWLFLLVLGLLMAFLSFVLDFLIEKCQQGIRCFEYILILIFFVVF